MLSTAPPVRGGRADGARRDTPGRPEAAERDRRLRRSSGRPDRVARHRLAADLRTIVPSRCGDGGIAAAGLRVTGRYGTGRSCFAARDRGHPDE